MRFLSLLVIFTLLVGLLPTGTAQASMPDMVTLAAPTSVTLVGDLQSELGCASDWDPTCAATNLTYDSEDQVWQGTFTIPAGSWLYKAATNGNWDNPYPPGFTNLNLSLASETSVKFYFDDDTPWMADSVSNVIATAVGNFQSELGCSGDWLPSCLRSWMQNPDNDNIYTFSTTNIPAGSYEGKVALNESWAVSYPGSNISFTVPNNGDTVTFTYNAVTNEVNISVTGSGASLDNNIWFSHLGHNSRDPLYRNPGGAVTTGTAVKLRLRAASGDLELARVRVWDDRANTSTIYNMTKVASGVSFESDPGPYEFWEVTLPASSVPTVYWYRFIVKDGTATAYYEDDNARTGGWGQTFATSPDNGYQLSIYDPAFTTPDWVKNAVVYQIFPDRFRDGDSSNNPTAGEFFYGNNDTIVRSNTTNWNTPVCDPRNRPGAVSGCLNKYSQNFYGGDLQGLIDELDYLDGLGITAIYLNPIFESPSNHKYDTTNYGQIDNNLGTLTDFQNLVTQASARGIKIIVDGVFNHVSSDSPYMDRYGRYPETGACESQTSPYRDWFYFTDVTPGTGVCVSSTGVPNAANYESWWGYDSLPKLNANNTEVRELIWAGISTPSPTSSIARYWIEQGADGWRLDVAPDVDPGTINDPTNDYWEGFRAAVHASDPNAYIVGEEWGNAISWTLGGEWDATMNYQFSAAVLSFWRDTAFTDNDFNAGSSAGPLNPITAEGVSERLRNLQERYPAEAFYAMLNLFGTHDTNRALFLLDHNTYQNDTALYANPAYDWSDAITRLKGAALMQMTLPGAPTIYYGDEIGLVGPASFDGSQWQDDPYNRQPYPWLDETGAPFYAHLQSTSSRNALFTYYQTLINARSAHPALRTGSFDPLWEQTGSNIYAYGRKMADDSDAAIVVVNKAATTGSVTLQLSGYLPAGLTLTDVLTSASFTIDTNGDLEVTNIPARGGYLLVPSSSFAGTRPAAPVISATASGGNQVNVSWSAVTGADVYVIYRSRLGGGGYEQLGATAGTSFTDTTVQPGTRYYYVARAVASNGLTSALSNEVSALPAYNIDWANLQWPFTLTADRSLVTPTTSIYGQVYIAGVTANPGPTPSLIAQVGYGNDGTLPTDASWRWFDTTFNGQAGNNDEFAGQLIPSAAPGSYDYLYRYSTDGGNTWVYGGNGWFGSNLTSYSPTNAGDLTITAPSDTTAPDAPTNLTVTGTTTDSISLAWDTHPNTDGDLYGFEVWRRDLTDGETSFTRVTLLTGPTLTAYTDTTVTADHEYEYYITAVDNNVNASGPSNTVTATAEMRIVAVTFRVNVPNPTPGTVYIAGSLPSGYPFWNPGGLALAEVSPGVWEVTIDALDGAVIEYKYARGSWETVEKGALHEEIANRSVTAAYGTNGTQLVTDTVANWRDPIVTIISPANGATGVSPSTTIEATWNQPMADPIDPATCFAINGPSGSVSGSVTYVSGDQKYVFTPDASLSGGAYTIAIGNCKDAQGDTQQVAFTSNFSVPANVIPSPWVGGVAIQSNQSIVAVARPHLGSQVASYIGSGAGSTTQYVPMLFKDAFGGSYKSALYIQNLGNASASLTIQFINDSGVVVHTITEPLTAKASKGYWLSSIAGIPAGFVGAAKVTADQPILAVGRPHIGAEVMSYNGMSAGSLYARLPMFFKNGFGSYNTALYVQNVTNASASLTIEYLNLDGTVACTDNDTLAANASKGYWSLTVTCDTGSLPMGFVGGVKVTSDQNILAVGRAHLGSQITTYNGFAGGAGTAYVPMLFKNAFSGGSYKSALYLQNVGGSSADVTIEYVNEAGSVVATQNVTLNAGAISSIWLPGVAGLPDGFVGGARITSTQDIIAVGRPHLGAEITAYNGAPAGGLTAYLPMLFKNAFGVPYNAAFYIQNVTSSTANVSISFYDDAGTLSCIKNITLGPNVTQGFWMPTVTCAP